MWNIKQEGPVIIKEDRPRAVFGVWYGGRVCRYHAVRFRAVMGDTISDFEMSYTV